MIVLVAVVVGLALVVILLVDAMAKVGIDDDGANGLSGDECGRGSRDMFEPELGFQTPTNKVDAFR